MKKPFSKQNWYILLIFTMLIWGTLAPVTRSLREVPQVLLAAIRMLTASAVVFVYVLLSKKSLMVEKKDIPLLAFVSILAGYAAPLFFNIGTSTTSAIIGSILTNSNPLFVPFLSLVLMKEKFVFRRIAYVLLGVIGVIVLSYSNKIEFSLSSGYLSGIFFLILGAVSVALNTVLVEKLVKKYSGMTVGAYYITIGAACLLAHSLLTKEFFQILSLPLKVIGPSIYIGIFPTALTWIIFLSSMQKLSPTEAATFKLLIPVFSTIFSIVFLREALTLALVLGGCIVISGVYLVQREGVKAGPDLE